jgi:hypothetical protein
MKTGVNQITSVFLLLILKTAPAVYKIQSANFKMTPAMFEK